MAQAVNPDKLAGHAAKVVSSERLLGSVVQMARTANGRQSAEVLQKSDMKCTTKLDKPAGQGVAQWLELRAWEPTTHCTLLYVSRALKRLQKAVAGRLAVLAFNLYQSVGQTDRALIISLFYGRIP